jgi:pimeloyl-ACP methyl ester carboxylesterase
MAEIAPRDRMISAWDGLALRVREWPGDPRANPLLCLPGIVRTAEDFDAPLARHAGRRRIVAIDYAGRGRSARSADVARYGAEACARDVADLCAALGVHRAIAIGTSFGGLLAMGLGALRPGLLAGVVLNDIGPEVGRTGADFVRRFVADDPALPDEAACAAHLRATLPRLSLATEAEWRLMARLTYEPGSDGRWHPRWDTRIAGLLDRGAPDLWPYFGAIAHVPLLLVHGAASEVLGTETVARMQAARPDMRLVRVAGVGHAPSLAEPSVTAALDAFLEAA